MSESKFIIRFSNVDRNKYVYYSPVTAKNGVVECRCEYKQDNNKTVPFFFESPKLIAASGIISLDNKFYIDLVVPMASPFLDWLLAEDEKNIDVTADNSEDWLGERTSVEEISQGYKTSLVFRSQDKNPILRVNIPNNRGKPGIEVFDNNKKLTTISEVVPGVEVACIMEKQPLRFYRDKFTGEYLIYKLKVCSTSQVVKLPPGYIFSEQSGGESEGEEQGSEQGDMSEEEDDPLAVSGDESDEGTESEEEDDPLAVSGDEEQSEEEDDPLAVSGDESEKGSESEEEDDPLAVSGDESEPESVNLDNYPDSEFSLGEGGEDEEISESKTASSKFMSSELTESDLDLSEFEA
jgi:hypothetical protein